MPSAAALAFALKVCPEGGPVAANIAATYDAANNAVPSVGGTLTHGALISCDATNGYSYNSGGTLTAIGAFAQSPNTPANWTVTQVDGNWAWESNFNISEVLRPASKSTFAGSSIVSCSASFGQFGTAAFAGVGAVTANGTFGQFDLFTLSGAGTLTTTATVIDKVGPQYMQWQSTIPLITTSIIGVF